MLAQTKFENREPSFRNFAFFVFPFQPVFFLMINNQYIAQKYTSLTLLVLDLMKFLIQSTVVLLINFNFI